VDEKGGKILQQLRRLGASPDWSKQAYTMSPQLSKAVLEAFLRMHANGLIYRDNRLVNWDTRLQSAVSDIEARLSLCKRFQHRHQVLSEALQALRPLKCIVLRVDDGSEGILLPASHACLGPQSKPAAIRQS